MEFKLTKQALEYFNEVEKALLLPHECSSKHKEMREIIRKLKNSDSTVASPERELAKMLSMLGRYSRPNGTCNIPTADIFYELFHKLFNLREKTAVFEKVNLYN